VKTATQFGPLPLVIGVTGHRDLRADDIAALESQVRKALEGLKTTYPSTPLLLLSPLAEGADRLVARVALTLGIRLIAPLPLRRTLYEEDFGPEGSFSRAEFAELLERAGDWFELPVVAGTSEDDIRKPGPARDRQYAQVGGYVARHSQILVALWDGISRSLTGGTSQIIRFKLEGGDDIYGPKDSPLDAPDSGPVYHIVTPRMSNPTPAGTPFALVKRFPGDARDGAGADAAFASVYASMEAFNRDAIEHERELAQLREQSQGWLYPGSEAAALSQRLRSLQQAFATADGLAIHAQAATFGVLRQLFFAVGLSALAFDVYAHLWPNFWVWAGYLALVAFTWLKWFVTRRRAHQDKYQDYRALAEGLRVQFFWDLVGVEASVAASYLRKQRNELDWIRNAIRVWSLPQGKYQGELITGAVDALRRLRDVLRYWVASQADYYERAAKQEEARRQRYRAWSRACLLASVGLGAVIFGATLLFDHVALPPFARGLRNWALMITGSDCEKVVPWIARLIGPGCEKVRDWVVLVIGMTAVLGALCHNFSEKRAFEQHAKEYARLGEIFARAKRRLDVLIEGGDVPQARRLLRELGQEALTEHGDWVLLHRARPIEVPEADGPPGVLPESLR